MAKDVKSSIRQFSRPLTRVVSQTCRTKITRKGRERGSALFLGKAACAWSFERSMEPSQLGKASKWLLAHERDLLASGCLRNATHAGASSVWLEADSQSPAEGFTTVYRPMGDAEVAHLLATNQLPNTQPYQAIIADEAGRQYAEKYLNGKKWVNTLPSTVVEFTTPAALIKTLFDMQHKAEDGAVSMGLGEKAGGGLPLFNDSLAKGLTTWRIVKVKRMAPKR